GADLGHAVAVRVTKEGDAVRAGHGPAGLLLVPLEEPALDALAVLRPRRRVRLRDLHVAVREHVDPSRMIETLGERHHGSARSGDGRRARGPALRLHD